MFQRGVDAKEFGEKLLDTVMYGSEIADTDGSVTISVAKGDDSNGED